MLRGTNRDDTGNAMLLGVGVPLPIPWFAVNGDMTQSLRPTVFGGLESGDAPLIGLANSSQGGPNGHTDTRSHNH